MKVCIINPAWRFVSRADVVYNQNLELGYLASYMRHYGKHSPYILDALALGYRSIESYADHSVRVGLRHGEIIEALEPNTGLIVVNVAECYLREEAETLCGALKKAEPEVPVVMTGRYPTVCPEDYAETQADYWLVGEGEHCLCELADGQPPETLNGFLTPKRPTVEQAGYSWRVEHLDDIPFPARDLLPMSFYLKQSQRGIGRKATAAVMTSRGCPWMCGFCSIPTVHGHRWRGRTTENVLDEIHHLIDHYGVRHIEFVDDNLTLHRKRAKEIFQGIMDLRYQHHIDLTWSSPNSLRCETTDRDMLKLMLRSGCTRISFALEHGDEMLRNAICRRMDFGKFERAVCNAIDIGLPVNVTTVVGYPGESAERFENGFAFYKQLRDWGVSGFQFQIVQPYPGTELYQYCQEKGYLIEDARSLMPEVKIETEDFSRDEVYRRREVLRQEFVRNASLREKVKSILPTRIADMINRCIPEKAI